MSRLPEARSTTSGSEPDLSAIRSLGYRGLAGAARVAMSTGFVQKGLRVLGYHDVPDESLFSEQLDWLTSHFEVVGLGEALARLESRRGLDRTALVTFDDADSTVVSKGLPVLEAFEVDAVMFVCPGVVDTHDPYWWQLVAAAAAARVEVDDQPVTQSDVARLKTVGDDDRREFVAKLVEYLDLPLPGVRQVSSGELRSWIAAGQSIGNHTWDHPILDACDLSEQESQIVRAHTWLNERGLMDIAVFAYPNGNRTDHAESVLRDLDYETALLFDHRIASGGDAMVVSRLRVNADDAMDVFIAKVSGLHPAMHRLAGRL